MGAFTQSRLSGDVGIIGASSTKITNLSLPTSGVEVSHALSSGLKSITIRSRNKSRLQFAFTALDSGAKYVTIEGCSSWTQDGLTLTGKTLYLQANNDSEIVEILEFF